MIDIVVCMKIVIDPEMPFSIFKIDRENQKPVPPSGMPPVFSPFDENALEAALKIKDGRDCRIRVLSMGKTIPKAILQKSLALGADEVIALEDPEFEELDPFTTAHTLARAIEKSGKFDLVFTGRQGADWDAGLVWAGIAETLNLPSVTLARMAKIHEEKVVVERCVSDGIETLESEMPALIAFTNEGNELRNLSLSAFMKIKKKEIPIWSAPDVAFERRGVMEMRDLYEPDLGERDCRLVPGESPEEKGRNLAKKFMDEGLLTPF